MTNLLFPQSRFLEEAPVYQALWLAVGFGASVPGATHEQVWVQGAVIYERGDIYNSQLLQKRQIIFYSTPLLCLRQAKQLVLSSHGLVLAASFRLHNDPRGGAPRVPNMVWTVHGTRASIGLGRMHGVHYVAACFRSTIDVLSMVPLHVPGLPYLLESVDTSVTAFC